ncbi:metal-sensing transcriptional repressor, partial [Vibrio parahaemolyticus]|nr:metal-sensing transcriptional repressor [Vibrio parahaemolyticus]
MSHTTRDQKKLNTRVSKIQGQVNGLKKMLEEEHECQDVLQQ